MIGAWERLSASGAAKAVRAAASVAAAARRRILAPMVPTLPPRPEGRATAPREGPPYLERCPRLVPVAGHPVFVAPEVDTNCFYLDGGYWLLPTDGQWRHSGAFDGPWWRVDPDHLPPALLRLPLSAYRAPPACLGDGPKFRPPRWDRLWGTDWARRHPGWERFAEPLRGREPAAPRPPAQQVQELQRSLPRRPAGVALSHESGDA